jgi:hypothetical protein
MSSPRRIGPRARAVALAAAAAAALAGAGALWLARSGADRGVGADEAAPLIGYSPGAPAGGSVARYETEYPTIPYTTGERTDPVAGLIDRIERREVELEWDSERGYLESLLAALEIDVSSQTLVYSQTSLQSRLINPRKPRAIYFNDDVYVAYVQDGPIEIAALDPSLGPVFYLLEQNPAAAPAFVPELGRCLSCHDSYSLTGGGVPRFIVGSGYTGTAGQLVSHEGWILISDRTPLKSRWGGWYVTGRHGSQVHLGNIVIESLDDFDRLEQLRVGNVDTLEALVDVEPYLTNTSDIVALLVLQHQTDVQNIITRLSWDARSAPERREDPLEATVERLLRTMLFVGAVPYTEPISGRADFVQQFASRAERDAQGRSLRDFDLGRRLFRYPLSYVVYSPAFDALPSDAKGLFYRRLRDILAGADTSGDFAALSAADRTAVLEILHDTKPDFAAATAE